MTNEGNAHSGNAHSQNTNAPLDGTLVAPGTPLYSTPPSSNSSSPTTANAAASAAASALPGPGTFLSPNSIITSTLKGYVTTQKGPTSSSPLTISVTPVNPLPTLSPGSLTLCLCLRSTPSTITCQILSILTSVNSTPTFVPLKTSTHLGQIQSSDITTVSTSSPPSPDSPDFLGLQSYRPSDLLLTRITSSTPSSYNLSTAEDCLGVIEVKCQCGGKMVPENFKTVKCKECGREEERKVAKP
ncbi:hypothetical protein TrVE_jg12008 [Triparma verrucosa]|uniref:Uncharacterized protein n=1 Tax=Triparma verrucosa TaxID=1606542 RepID=A0A9W7FP98_9STRA|nr:hypothetical protein TrVE_jg12008 [Triparma verrucosa]